MKYAVPARYGAMRSIGTFTTSIKNLRLGDRCILRTGRGAEWGEIIGGAQDVTPDSSAQPDGAVLRRVTPQDYKRRQEIEERDQAGEFSFCADKITERALPMRLASVEHIFGGEKIIFYFLAEGRVDFRQLVKDLATEYKTRIELRQIGVRDEARLLAEYEHCGRELCCRTFIRDLEPVTMRMAKHQKTTLDPAKISGRCGRLMCCLRFEDETYADLKSRLPAKGARVKLSEGVGEVVSSETLAQTVTVDLADRRTVKVQLSDIEEVLPDEKPGQARRRPVEAEARGPGAAQPARPRRRSRGRGKERSDAARQPEKPARDRAEAAEDRAEARPQASGPPSRPQPEQPTPKAQAPKPQPTPPPEPPAPAKPKPERDELVADEWWEEPSEREE